MLLRRVTLHIQEQNWFAVFIDFLIVVVGVFIGIQVANWNTERLENQNEEALLISLTEDFSAHAIELERRLVRAEQSTIYTSELIKLIRNKQQPTNADEITVKLRYAIRYSAPVPMPTSFAEALQSGKVVQLKNQRLRRLLNEYQVARDWWSSVSGPAGPQFDPNSHLLKGITMSADVGRWDGDTFRVLDYDWTELLKADKELSVVHRWQSFQLEAYRIEKAAVEKVLAELKR